MGLAMAQARQTDIVVVRIDKTHQVIMTKKIIPADLYRNTTALRDGDDVV